MCLPDDIFALLLFVRPKFLGGVATSMGGLQHIVGGQTTYSWGDRQHVVGGRTAYREWNGQHILGDRQNTISKGDGQNREHQNIKNSSRTMTKYTVR